MSCLRTGDQQSAHKCLERLTERFGADNERVMALRGLYQEATAHDEAGLELILKEYNTIIEHESSNIVHYPAAVSFGRVLTRCSLSSSVVSHY